MIIASVVPIDEKEKDWQVNGVGHNVSHHYGFGLMDVGRAVRDLFSEAHFAHF